MLHRFSALVLIGVCSFPAVSLADDWTVVKLRGAVQQQVAGQWEPLARGDVVSDNRPVRTLIGGRVEFVRGEEHLALEPNTLIQIYDRGGAKPFTTVAQAFGTVSVEAKVEDVQHFAVQTPLLAAVVKGTKFTVHSGRGGASVDVERGHVAVENEQTHSKTTLAAGQKAEVEHHKEVEVSGSGSLPPVVSDDGVIISAFGKPLDELSESELESLAEQATDDAKLLNTPETKAAAKAAEKALKDSEKAAKNAEKSAGDAAKDAAKTAKDAAKDAEKAAKDAAKQAEKAAKEGTKQAEDAAKDAQKAADDAKKAADKAADDAKKAADKATKDAKDATKDAEKDTKDSTKNVEDAASRGRCKEGC